MKCLTVKLLAALFLIALWPLQAHAAKTVENMYEAIVPLADRSIDSRNAAISDALEQVLIRFSGYSGIASLSGVSEALAAANSYAIEFSVEMQLVPSDDGLATKKADALWVRFNAAQVDKLFDRHQLPIWPTLRSDVKYIVLRDYWGQPTQSSAETYPAMATALSSAFNERGMQAEQYSSDLFSAAEMWNLSDVNAYQLRNESEADLLVIVKAVEDRIVGAFAELMIISDSKTSVFRQRNMDAISGARLILDDYVDDYSSGFAFIGGSGQDRDLFLSISGVREFALYKRVLEVINDIDQVKAARLEFLRGDEMVFRVSYGSNQQRFLNAVLERTNFQRAPNGREALGTRSDPLMLWLENYSGNRQSRSTTPGSIDGRSFP